MAALSCLGNGYFQLTYHKAWRHYILGSCKIVHRGIEHGCQNRDLDRKITRFYDLTSPKRLKLYPDRKNGRIICRIV